MISRSLCAAEYKADAAERVTACVLVAGAAPLLATSQRPRRLGQRIEGGRLIEISKLNLERSKIRPPEMLRRLVLGFTDARE